MMSEIFTTVVHEIAEHKDIGMTIVLLIVGFFFLKPYMKENQQIQKEGFAGIKDASDKNCQAILTAFKDHEEEDHIRLDRIFDELKSIRGETGKTILTNEQIVSIARAQVWFTSKKKMDFIRRRLEKNNLVEREEQIKRQIRVELERRSQEYIEFLNQFKCSQGPVGDWVANNFPMDEFMKEIYDVVFTGAEIPTKMQDISTIMEFYQNEMWEKFKKEI